jgi:hypothetical protein
MAAPQSYTSLEPDNLRSLGVSAPSFKAGETTSLFATSSFLYSLFFTAIVIAAFYRYILAGALRMQANEQSIRLSNEIIKKVTLGLLGVFSLFLLLVTVNKGLVSGDVGLGGLRTQSATSNSQANNVSATTNQGSTPSIPKNNDDPLGWNAIRDDAAVRAQLRALTNGGIEVNRGVCNNPTQITCTTLGGLPPSTLSMLASLRQECSGTITITGGSETGHKSHGPGKSPVDLSVNSPGGLNNCIQSFPQGTPLTWCKKTYTKFGYTFCDELFTAPHWHVFQN